MFRQILCLAAVLLTALPLGAARAAQPDATASDTAILLQAIRANRRALVAVNLALSEEEAAKFWPIYDAYERDLTPSGDRMAALIEEYSASFRTLSNERALALMQDYLAAEAERLQLRRDYVSRFAAVLPGRTVARFYQIENKMDAVIRYDLAGAIPVVEEPASAPAQP